MDYSWRTFLIIAAYAALLLLFILGIVLIDKVAT